MPSTLRSGKEYRVYEPLSIPSFTAEDFVQLAAASLPVDDNPHSPNAGDALHLQVGDPTVLHGSNSGCDLPNVSAVETVCEPSTSRPPSFGPHRASPVLDTSSFEPYPVTKPSRQHRKRKKQRAKMRKEEPILHRPEVLQQHLRPALDSAVKSKFTAANFTQCVQSSGYMGKRSDLMGEPHPNSLKEALDIPLDFVPWDASHDKPFCLSESHVVVALAGRPADETYMKDVAKAYDLVMDLQKKLKVQSGAPPNRRGPHNLLNFGILHGNGSKEPHNLHTHGNDEIVRQIREDKSFQRLAGFANSALKMWFPRLHALYSGHLGDIIAGSNRPLAPSFPNSVFPTSCINFGPRVITQMHRDSQNFPFGVCAVQALGNYDYKQGGHLILWELGLVVEFPPGSTILLPSAVITHSNLPIPPSQQRASLVHYAPGALFQYADYGLKTITELAKEGAHDVINEKRSADWKSRINYYSTLGKLEDGSDYLA